MKSHKWSFDSHVNQLKNNYKTSVLKTNGMFVCIAYGNYIIVNELCQKGHR